jgi:hypothetical protein
MQGRGDLQVRQQDTSGRARSRVHGGLEEVPLTFGLCSSVTTMWGPSAWGPHGNDTTAEVGTAEDLVWEDLALREPQE